MLSAHNIAISMPWQNISDHSPFHPNCPDIRFVLAAVQSRWWVRGGWGSRRSRGSTARTSSCCRPSQAPSHQTRSQAARLDGRATGWALWTDWWGYYEGLRVLEGLWKDYGGLWEDYRRIVEDYVLVESLAESGIDGSSWRQFTNYSGWGLCSLCKRVLPENMWKVRITVSKFVWHLERDVQRKQDTMLSHNANVSVSSQKFWSNLYWHMFVRRQFQKYSRFAKPQYLHVSGD